MIRTDWYESLQVQSLTDSWRWFVMEKSNILLYKRRSNIFPHIGRSEIGRQFARDCLSFFMNWNNIYFFYSSRKIPLSKHELKIISRVWHIDGPNIFNIIFNLLTLFGVDYKAHLKAVRQLSISDVRQDPNYAIYRPLVRKNWKKIIIFLFVTIMAVSDKHKSRNYSLRQ